jgi:hypothetical protein
MSRVVLSKAAFLASANDRKREDVPMPEFGDGAVIPVWAMTARERTTFERQFATSNGKTVDARLQEFRERLLVASCRTDDGQPMFTLEDVAAIGSKDAAIVERLVNAAQRLSGFTQQDIEATVGN